MFRCKLTNFLGKPKFQYSFKSFSKSKSQVETDKRNLNENSETRKWNNDENVGREFERTKYDVTDKSKPFDNYEAMIYHPELKEQMEKRKDIYHTLETPYLIKEKEQKEKENKEKDIHK